MINIAIDTETHLIHYPDQVNPEGVCLSYSASNGIKGLLHFKKDRDKILSKLKFWLSHEEIHIVGQNISFDLHVILKTFPELSTFIWDSMVAGRIHDTMLRERLYLISTEGRHDAKLCSLAALCDRHLGIKLEGKDGDAWRFRYSELEDINISDWPEEAVQYAILDAIYTLKVYQEQESIKAVSGPGSINGETLQVAAAFTLRAITLEGVAIDSKVVDEISDEYHMRHDESKESLMELGMLRPDGSRDMQAIRDACEKAGATAKTKTGAISTSKSVLDELEMTPDIKALKEYSDTLKAVTTFIPQLSIDRIHPEYNPMVSTLRVSCKASNYYKYKGQEYGKRIKKRGSPLPSINFQQIPREGGFRRAFVPDGDNLFICADYSNLELICTAQTALSLFGFSKMATILNSGENLHTNLGHELYNRGEKTNISLDKYKELYYNKDKKAQQYRQAAKPINLGCPGGQGAETIRKTAKANYGIELTADEARDLRDMAFTRYSEFDNFFGNNVCPGWIAQQRNGSMYKKNVDTGRIERKPRYDTEICGVWFAKKTYAALANGVNMQIPAAIGVKQAMVKLYRECTDERLGSVLFGCTLKAQVHDEFLMQAPRDRVRECQDRMATVMLEAMKLVCPDMRIACESSVCDRWGKSFDDNKEYALEADE